MLEELRVWPVWGRAGRKGSSESVAVTGKLLMGGGVGKEGELEPRQLEGAGSSSPSRQVLLASSGWDRGDVGPRATDVSSSFGLWNFPALSLVSAKS